MDAALFVPYSIASYDFDIGYKWNVFDWFGMVHGIPVNTVIERLGNLKAKSLLENLGDGFSRIGMHDLWREFAELETKVGYFERRRWIFEWDEYNVHDEGHVTSRGASWVNLRRMYFLEMGFMKLEDVNFDCFPNVTVLKLSRNNESPLVLDVSSLKQLRSLELEVKEELVCRPYQRRSVTSVGLVGLGLLSKLGFLRWSNIPSDSSCIDEIGRLTNLQVLDLSGKGRLPDVSNLVLLRVVCFRQNRAAEAITGLGSKHTNLRYLDFRGCEELRSCPGVSELVALQELRLTNCGKLEEVPNLQKLKRLVILRVDGCHLITALPGLNELVNLQELNTFGCENLSELPGMENHRNLRVLDVGRCSSLTSLPGLEELVTLQSLDTRGCSSLIQWPDMRKLTNLQRLKLDPNPPLQSTAGLSDLISLRTLFGGFCDAQDWPDLRNLTSLEVLLITGWPAQVLPNLADFVRLESITLYACRKARVLPDLQRLTRVNKLCFRYCEFEDMSGLSNVISLKDLTIMDCEKLETVPDLGNLARLESLTVERCARLRDFRGILALRNLRILWAEGHPWLHENLGPDLGRLTGLMHLDVSDGGFADLQWLADFSHMRTLRCRGCPVQELPDLAKFPELYRLDVRNCVNLTKLTCTGTLNPNFSFLEIEGCRRLTSLPDLSNSRDMRKLHVANSGVVMSLEAIQEVKNRWPDIDFVTELADSQTDEPAHAQTAAVPFRQPVLARFVFSMVRCCAGRELWIRAA